MLIALIASLPGCTTDQAEPVQKWWKGNLHTHSLWSDGDEFPEVIVGWYKRHGYHFVAMSDHNILATGDKWLKASGSDAFRRYLDRFGREHIRFRVEANDTLVRLNTFDEYGRPFEEPNRFIVIQSEEITDAFEAHPVHVNATNLVELIPPQGGASVLEVMQNNVDAVNRQREATGRAILPHVNHPNYQWAITAEEIAELRGERFFEIYNGHPAVNNFGDSLRPSTEKMWDIVLSLRLTQGKDVMYGLAVDDAHHYQDEASNLANPGRGWIVVRSKVLTAEAIIGSMESGDFYASTGVRLEDVQFDGETITVSASSEQGVTYRTQFVGTRTKAADELVSDNTLSNNYLKQIGEVFDEQRGNIAIYELTGDELYVRAKVISSRVKANPYREGEYEVAWTQPYVGIAD